MAALSIRNLDDDVKRRLQRRAARNGRSMEAEVRSILEDAARSPEGSSGLLSAVRDRFGAVGGVDLDLPERRTPARAPDLGS